jgi:hypothetical protein
LLFKTLQFIKGKFKAFPRYAVKAHCGVEVQLYRIKWALDGGEEPAGWRVCCTAGKKPSVPSNRRLVQPEGQKLYKTAVLCLCTPVKWVSYSDWL